MKIHCEDSPLQVVVLLSNLYLSQRMKVSPANVLKIVFYCIISDVYFFVKPILMFVGHFATVEV